MTLRYLVTLHVSADEVSGSLDDEECCTEETPYDPSSPYSATEAASESLARAWDRTYGLPVIVTNFSDGLVDTVAWYLDNEVWWQGSLSGVYRAERIGTGSHT